MELLEYIIVFKNGFQVLLMCMSRNNNMYIHHKSPSINIRMKGQYHCGDGWHIGLSID